MQISYFIPSLYSLGREENSNNSISRQLHKSLKNSCNSDAISGMPRIMQRLFVLHWQQAQALPSTLPPCGWHPWEQPLCTLQRRVMGFLLTSGPFFSNYMQYLLRNQSHFQHCSLTVPSLVHHIQTLPVLAPTAAISIKCTENPLQH